MFSSKIAALFMAGFVGVTSAGHAQESVQSSTVTFEVPLNLTRLSPSITQVAVTCDVTATPRPITARVEVPVTAGQVVRTVAVLVDLWSSDFRAGDMVRYECTLLGLNTGVATRSALTGWATFDARNGAPYAVSPAPAPIVDSFRW